MISTDRVKERILSSVAENDAGCWIWQKSKGANGYGKFAWGGGNTVGSHRVSYECFVGKIPDGMLVCHKCDVKDCVNPDHLFVGTQSENLFDASRKNRVSRDHHFTGTSHPRAKLTEEKIRSILSMLSKGKTFNFVAARHGVSKTTVGRVKKGVGVKHFLERSAA